MGRNANRRRNRKMQPGSTPREHTASEHPTISAAHRLVTALKEFEQSTRGDPDLGWVDLPDFFADVAEYPKLDLLDEDLQTMEAAWAIIDQDLPVAGTFRHPAAKRDEPHRRWEPPLTPEEIIRYHKDAKQGDPGFWVQAQANASYYGEHRKLVAQHADSVCGRPTNSGRSCQKTPIWIPNAEGGTVPGYACWQHLSSAEQDEVRATYDAAERTAVCRGCGVEMGQPCQPEVRPVGGHWPRERVFQGHMVHDCRLWDWARMERTNH